MHLPRKVVEGVKFSAVWLDHGGGWVLEAGDLGQEVVLRETPLAIGQQAWSHWVILMLLQFLLTGLELSVSPVVSLSLLG